MNRFQETEPLENNFNLKEEIVKYLFYWKWFLVGVLLSFLIAYIYLRYAQPTYKATSTILVQDNRKGAMASEVTVFSDLSMFSNMSNNVDNEVEIIKSRTLIEKVVQDLNLTTTYYSQGRVKSEEIYGNQILQLHTKFLNKDFKDKSLSFKISIADNNTFEFFDSSENKVGKFKFEDEIKTKEGTFYISKTPNFLFKEEINILINIIPKDKIIESIQARLSVSGLSKNTSIIQLSIVDPVRKKAEDIVNQIVINYNLDAVTDKKFIAENTSKFINERLALITDELEGVEKNQETFRKSNSITDVVSEAGIYLDNASEYEKKEIEVATQLNVVESMMGYVKRNGSNDLIPANVLPADQGASQLINDYNKLILDREKQLKSAGEQNPKIIALDQRIAGLRNNIESSLKQLKNSLSIQRRDIGRQTNSLKGKISQIPTLGRLSKDLERKQQIKESLYLYLLQKREENALSLAVTAPNAKIIDSAVASKNPVSPKKSIIYLAAFLLGLIIPFTILYIVFMLDTKIKTRYDVEHNTTIPFLGEIPKLTSGQLILNTSSRSSTAEALRIIRTNLEFILSDVVNNKAKTIFVTSTYPKEGKTFIALNLASTIALSEKRVLLVGLDIRNPKLQEYLTLPEKGITNFLTNKENHSIEKYIVKAKEVSNLDVLTAGVIPPNPAELLMSNRLGNMFGELKSLYDYIIVDTAPISLVTDTLLVAKLADAFIYVTRANFLDKRMLELPEKLYKEKKLPNMTIVINDTDAKKGYGYGYGYGKEEENDKSISLFNKLKDFVFSLLPKK